MFMCFSLPSVVQELERLRVEASTSAAELERVRYAQRQSAKVTETLEQQNTQFLAEMMQLQESHAKELAAAAEECEALRHSLNEEAGGRGEEAQNRALAPVRAKSSVSCS